MKLKEVNEALEAKKNKEALLLVYQHILSKLSTGIHAIDETGKTIIYNQKMVDIEGMNIEDVLDKNLLDVFQFGEEEDSTLLKVLKTGEPILNVKQTYFNNKGQEINTVNNSFPIIENGITMGAVEIARDITKLEKLIKTTDYRKEDHISSFEQFIHNSPYFEDVIETCERTTQNTTPVLIIGENGTYKELFARIIHHHSNRSGHPFISQNCSALPQSIIEKLLFGNEESGGSDATLITEADGGTLLLEDIHYLSAPLQMKLLHLIQEKKLAQQKENDAPINIRFIATMDEDPIDAIAAGKLRKDLYYKLSAESLFIPALRTRKTDIPKLISFYLHKYNARFGLSVKGVSKKAMDYLKEYHWPGNERELEHVIKGAFELIDQDELITFDHLPLQFRQKNAAENEFLIQRNKDIKPLDEYIQEAETYYIQKAMLFHDYNITKTAKALGMSRQNLQYRIRKYDIERPDFLN